MAWAIFDEIYGEYPLTPTDDLIRFWKSEVKVTAGRRGGRGNHVDAGALSSCSCLLKLKTML